MISLIVRELHFTLEFMPYHEAESMGDEGPGW
jgi:hypothetical protein